MYVTFCSCPLPFNLDHRGVEAFCAWLSHLSVELQTVPLTMQPEDSSASDNFQSLAACSSHWGIALS